MNNAFSIITLILAGFSWIGWCLYLMERKHGKSVERSFDDMNRLCAQAIETSQQLTIELAQAKHNYRIARCAQIVTDRKLFVAMAILEDRK